MLLDDNVIDRDRFDCLTKQRWVNEPLEVFACGNCDRILVGVPYCHELFLSADDLSKTTPYNRPHGTICPTCEAVIQGVDSTSREPRVDEMQESEWAWLFRLGNEGPTV